jgi:hypothetical protein
MLPSEPELGTLWAQISSSTELFAGGPCPSSPPTDRHRDIRRGGDRFIKPLYLALGPDDFHGACTSNSTQFIARCRIASTSSRYLGTLEAIRITAPSRP